MLIAVAISVAFAASWAATLGVGDLDFWWELAALIVVMLLGHWLEMRAIGQASGALDALAALLPDEAERVVAGEVEHVAVGALRPGDVVLVRPGARVPADGTIVEGLNHLEGDDALNFVRERYSFTDGDYTRVKNQQAFMTAIVDL